MKIDKNLCGACLMCLEECQFNAISVDMSSNTKGYKGVIIDENICMDCEACVEVCPMDAIIES
jgi:heterodisulfide reductase subunit A